MTKKQEKALGKFLARRVRRVLSRKNWPHIQRSAEDRKVINETADMLRVALDILDNPLDSWTAREMAYSGLAFEIARANARDNIKTAMKLLKKLVSDLEFYRTTTESLWFYDLWKQYREDIYLNDLYGFGDSYRSYFEAE